MPSPAKPSSSPRSKQASNETADRQPRVMLLVGAEAENKNAEVKRLLGRFVSPDFADFDSEILDGNTTTADRVLSAVNLAPFGSEKRVVVVRDSQQMNPDEQKRVAGAVERIAANGLLVLHTGTPIIEEGKTKRASVVLPELSSAVKKYGTVIEFVLPRNDDVRGWIVKEAGLIGRTLTAEALNLLSQLTGEDLQRVRTEIAKAAAHAGETNVITDSDVEATISRGSDDVIFKLCDAIGSRRPAEALGHVSTLFKGTSARPDAVAARTLVLIIRQIRLLTQFHYLVERRMAGRGAPSPSAEVMALLPAEGAGGMVDNPRTRWMADKYATQARNFSGAELAHRLNLLLESDMALKGIKSGGEVPQAMLQRLVYSLC